MAVYTPVAAQEIAAFLETRKLGALISHDGIVRGIENTNYLLLTTTGLYILTLFEKRVDPADLPFVFAFTAHLRAAGLPVPRLMAQGMLAGKHAAVIEHLKGHDVPLEDLTPDHCREAGATLARMHMASISFKPSRENPVGPTEWQRLFEAVKGGIEPALAKTITRTMADIEEYDWQALPRGAVHADYFCDNVFFDEEGRLSGIIDFYFACTAPFAYDLAITLNAWCYAADGRAEPARIKSMLEGYEQYRKLDPLERAAFPTLRRAAALRFLMTRLYDWVHTPVDAAVVRKDPAEYRAKLEAGFKWPS